MIETVLLGAITVLVAVNGYLAKINAYLAKDAFQEIKSEVKILTDKVNGMAIDLGSVKTRLEMKSENK